jgi:hypothetical protein
MFRSSWVAAQMAASQEGLSSVDLVIATEYHIKNIKQIWFEDSLR